MAYQIHDKARQMSGAEAEVWLRGRMAELTARRLTGQNDYKNRAGSYVSRTIGGRPALSWAADFIKAGENWTEYGTLIRSDKGHAVVSMKARATEIDTIRPRYETLVESVRLP